jgi:RNA polymerase sigma factor (sigma-70 family)
LKARLEQHFHQMLNENGKLLRHLVSGYEANAAVQEELFQEIALAIWTALPKFRGEASARTFLARIAHNRLASHVDKSVKRVKTESYEQGEHDLPCDSGHMEDNMVAEQRVNHLLAAVRKLKGEDRQLVSLALEGFAYDEMADVLGLSVNHIGVRLNRAKSRLKELLEVAQ